MQSRKILVNIGLTAFATLLAGFIVFIFGEAYFRLTIQADRPGPSHEFKVYHPTRGWALRPGAYSYFDFRAFRDVKIRINEFGLRNQQISLSLPANKQRVTVLGDSFVFAAALNDGEHLTDQLQELAENRWEVVNASVEGYGTGQQILLLKELLEHGYTMGNHIILAFFTNDILDNVGLGYEGKPSPSKPISQEVANELYLEDTLIVVFPNFANEGIVIVNGLKEVGPLLTFAASPKSYSSPGSSKLQF